MQLHGYKSQVGRALVTEHHEDQVCECVQSSGSSAWRRENTGNISAGRDLAQMTPGHTPLATPEVSGQGGWGVQLTGPLSCWPSFIMSSVRSGTWVQTGRGCCLLG